MSICLIDNTPDDLLALRAEKKKVALELQMSKKKIFRQSQVLFSPFSDKSKKQKHDFSSFLSNGLAIYQGVRIGLKCFNVLHSVFGSRKIKIK